MIQNDPALTATIVTNNQIYPGWQSVEIWREYGQKVSYMKFVAVEDEARAGAYSVVPGDLAQGYLAGEKVIDGQVITRQVALDKATHAVEVVVASNTQNALVGTVANNPGQYKQQTIMQIASAALAKVSVNVQTYRRDERDRNTVRDECQSTLAREQSISSSASRNGGICT